MIGEFFWKKIFFVEIHFYKKSYYIWQGSTFWSINDIYSPPPWKWYFPPLVTHRFFDYYCSIFALILPYFAFILPVCFTFSHFLSPFFLFLSPFILCLSPFLPLSILISSLSFPFFLCLSPSFVFPFSSFFLFLSSFFFPLYSFSFKFFSFFSSLFNIFSPHDIGWYFPRGGNYIWRNTYFLRTVIILAEYHLFVNFL